MGEEGGMVGPRRITEDFNVTDLCGCGRLPEVDQGVVDTGGVCLLDGLVPDEEGMLSVVMS